MTSALAIIFPVLSDGIMFGFAAIGVAIIIGWGRMADLTPDAAFTSGAVGMWFGLTHGMNVFGSVAFGFLSGVACGVVTATIVLAGVPTLLASLVVLGFAYSANWTILGSPLRTLANDQTIFYGASASLQLLVLIFLLVPFVLVIRLFVSTAFGLKLRAISENPNSVPDGGRSMWVATVIWLAVGNGMVGMSGALFASRTFIIDINMGSGTLISALSAFLFGWAALRFSVKVSMVLSAALLGGVFLHGLLSIALIAGAPAQFFRGLIAAALLGCLLIASRTSRNILSGLRL